MCLLFIIILFGALYILYILPGICSGNDEVGSGDDENTNGEKVIACLSSTGATTPVVAAVAKGRM